MPLRWRAKGSPILPKILARRIGGRICQAGIFSGRFMAARQMALDRRTVTLSGMETYPMAMLVFRLPPGYRLQMDPDELLLRRADGSTVAAFSGPGTDPAEVAGEAVEDYRRSGEDTA